MVLALLALPVVLILAGCSGQAEETASITLPPQIHNMVLTEERWGPEAAEEIARLHGKGVAPAESVIAHYGAGPDHSMLYVSRFASAPESDSALQQMSLAIGDASSGFSHHNMFPVGGREIHVVVSTEQVHFFYADDALLLWLAVSPAMARASLAELLGTDLESVPPIGSVLGPR